MDLREKVWPVCEVCGEQYRRTGLTVCPECYEKEQASR